MQIDDPNEDPFAALARRVADLERQAGLGKSSVSDGQTQFIGLLSLLVSGSAKVTGELIIDGAGGKLTVYGDVDGQGAFTWRGPEIHQGDEIHNGTAVNNGPTTNNGDVTNIGKTTQAGDYEGNGKFKQTGDEEHQGTESHKGNITNEGTTIQKGDLEVAYPGVFRVGAGVTITPFPSGGGRIDFNPGGRILGSATVMTLIAADGTAYIVIGNNGLTVNGYVSAGDLFTTGDVYLRHLPPKP